ncbi:MAG: GNAT family N-acetyltransferase [Caulobacteraceae bacterium]
MTQLITAIDHDFAWLLGEESPAHSLHEAPGGVEERSILKWLRAVSARLEAGGHLGSFLIVDEGEVVGLCGFRGPPDISGSGEIGYGIAASRRRLGHATRAVALMCAEVRQRAAVTALRAETSTQNPASQRVLEYNGFAKVGSRHDDEDGDLLLWSKTLRAPGEGGHSALDPDTGKVR